MTLFLEFQVPLRVGIIGNNIFRYHLVFQNICRKHCKLDRVRAGWGGVGVGARDQGADTMAPTADDDDRNGDSGVFIFRDPYS